MGKQTLTKQKSITPKSFKGANCFSAMFPIVLLWMREILFYFYRSCQCMYLRPLFVLYFNTQELALMFPWHTLKDNKETSESQPVLPPK